ncbi:MAG: glycosyltransferase family 4 protein [Alphaproteobacteria bacterium]
MPAVRIVSFTTLYPSSARPTHGVFVENRLRHLVASGAVTTRVVVPVPWFPSRHSWFGSYADFARTPPEEERFGIPIVHPRYVTIPKAGMTIAPALLFAGSLRALRKVEASGYDYRLIDAHYFYPDGVAAAMLARRLNKPVVITARGTDINLIPRHALPRRMILWAAREAAAVITVCQALKDTLVSMGVPDQKVTVLRNGVDLVLFRPLGRDAARRTLGIEGPTILSVGHLIPRKGHDIVIRALAEIPEARLIIAGTGPEDRALRRLTETLGLDHRVRFAGAVPHERLAEYYSAADVLALGSDREGWANVLLESMACGTPVAATNIWGTPEVVAVPEAGLLVQERTGPAMAAALRALLARPPDRTATRAYAERFSWDATTEGQIAIFRRISAQAAARAA